MDHGHESAACGRPPPIDRSGETPYILYRCTMHEPPRENPLGGFLLKDEDFEEMTRLVKGIAARHANGRVVSLLEGGYGLGILGGAVAAHVGALRG